MNETQDTTMTESQQSQFMRDKFPPQGARQDSNRVNTDGSNRQSSSKADAEQQVELRRTAYNADMITKNNNMNRDAGVTDVIKDLLPEEDKNKYQLLKKITRDPLVAGLGFLFDLPFSDAKAQYKSLKVDEIRSMIVTKYNSVLPQLCKGCKGIFLTELSIEPL